MLTDLQKATIRGYLAAFALCLLFVLGLGGIASLLVITNEIYRSSNDGLFMFVIIADTIAIPFIAYTAITVIQKFGSNIDVKD